MLRGFRKPYRKLFIGEMFTTVRVLRDGVKEAARVGTIDTIFVYPRTPRMTKLGRAQIVALDLMRVDVFKRRCTEEFARYDAETTAAELVKSIENQCRKTGRPLIGIFTYIWIEKTAAHEQYANHFKEISRAIFARLKAQPKSTDVCPKTVPTPENPVFGEKREECPKGGEHDYTASFEGGDTYRCQKCSKMIDMTED